MSDDELDTLGYLYGELSEDEAESLEAALAASPELAEELEGQAALLLEMREVDFNERVPPGLARLALGEAERRPQPLWTRLRSKLMGPAWAAAAGLVAVVALFVIVPSSRKAALNQGSAPASLELDTRAGDDLAQNEREPPEPDVALISEPLPGSRRPAARPAKTAKRSRPERPRSASRFGSGAAPKRRSARLRSAVPAPSQPTALASAEEVAPSDRAVEDDRLPNLAAAPRPPEAPAVSPTAGGAAGFSDGVGAVGQLSGRGGGARDEAGDRNAGQQAEAARLLVQSALQDRARGHLDEARQALGRAAARAYRLPLLGEILLLRAEIEFEDHRYTEARTFAEEASLVPGFAETKRAKSLAQRARRLEAQNRN